MRDLYRPKERKILDLLELQLKLAPDVLEIMQRRYKVLQHISLMQPIGRRNLSQSLNWTERTLRAEVDFLKLQGLVEVETIGMRLTDEGFKILHEVSPYIKKIFGLSELEQRLQSKFQLPRVIVVGGDADQDELVKKEMGRAAANLLRQIIKEDDIVAITGGSTLVEVANMMPEHPQLNSVLFVPARGGVGENHEYQANTIVSQMAKKTGGKYQLFYVPDILSDETYKSLMNESHIQDSLKLILSARILIHGIGNAKTMAMKRRVPEKTLISLEEHNAVGEAFGYYFAEGGKIVYKMNTIGIRLEDLENIPNIISVAGGKSKANAIIAALKHNYGQTLITDEGAAKEILNLS